VGLLGKTGFLTKNSLTIFFRSYYIGVGSISIGGTMKKVSLPIYEEELQADMEDRLNRIEGQVKGVARMIVAQRPCMEVLQQLASVQAALKGLTKTVMRNYLERCATDAIKSGDTAVYDELMEAIYKFVK
jgi:DNA-binding FrmR family transcriptional regulator